MKINNCKLINMKSESIKTIKPINLRPIRRIVPQDTINQEELYRTHKDSIRSSEKTCSIL